MSALTVLYTAQLRGQLDLLPRLFSLMQAVRGATVGPALLIDLGDSCDPQVRECAATGGRATLFVLEAMGYDGACLSQADSARLTDDALHKLLVRVSLGLCGPARPGLPDSIIRRVGSLEVVLLADPASLDSVPASAHLVICRAVVGEPAHLAGRVLWLPPVKGNRLGVARLTFGNLGGSGQPVAVQVREESLQSALRVDATVAAAVDFVREEVRQYQG